MAQLLTPAPAASISTKKTHLPVFGFQRVLACHQAFDERLIHRRAVTLGLASAALGLTIGGHSNRSALAARRPPPPPPEEKKDPGVSGVQAKVIASKKRKEAMKEAMAKLREKGKAINEPSE